MTNSESPVTNRSQELSYMQYATCLYTAKSVKQPCRKPIFYWYMYMWLLAEFIDKEQKRKAAVAFQTGFFFFAGELTII